MMSPAAWIGSLIDPDAFYAWDENGKRRKRIVPIVPTSPDLGAITAAPVFGFGAAPGEPGRLDLNVDAIETKLGFTVSSVLLVGSAGLLRSWPLRLLDPAALPALPTAGDGLDGCDWAAVRGHVRRGAVCQDVYIALVDDCVGHGLFAGAAIVAGEFIGEYTGVVSEDGCGGSESNTDGYRMRYPGIGLTVSAREVGSMIRFVNHSGGGAANVNIFPVFVDGGFHMCCVATAAIPKHAQILLDYGAPYWRDEQVPVEQSRHDL